MKLLKPLILLFCFIPCFAMTQIDTTVFSLIDMKAHGLERTAELYAKGDFDGAGAELLKYYKSRTIAHPEIDLNNIEVSSEDQRWADEGLKHIFFVHYGYQPSFFYGDDIDWLHWPVKDNELRWQLHRTKWWLPMGKAYRSSGDEKYAKEWTFQYLDWIEKNPLLVKETHDRSSISSGEINYSDHSDKQSALIENVRFAWRPLEVSDRLEFQIHQFAYFISSPNFTAEFLSRFLVNYHRHATHITQNFSASGNHLLFEAQRLTFAGVYFPEFRDAATWRSKGVEILNREIEKQVYDDGMQYELDPHYHIEAINIFFKALRMMDANGYRGEFPKSYIDTIESMIVVYYNICFPDYTNPCFSDAKLHEADYNLPCYKAWATVYPDNQMIRWMASEGREGKPESYLSQAFKTSGMYILRNGWDMNATAMIIKAGPPAFWHNQPDNGTFEMWRKGRNFFPDSGSYVFAGNKEINEMRDWFRQSKVHNTLTLNGENITGMDSKCVYWNTDGNTDVVAYENPSYEGLTHRRSVFFVNREFYVIVDEAYGTAKGDVALHYNLIEGEVLKDFRKMSVSTLFNNGNNIKLQVFGQRGQRSEMKEQEGWVSRAYRERFERPAFSFSSTKSDNEPVRFITVILPEGIYKKSKIEAEFEDDFSTNSVDVDVEIGGKTFNLKYKY